MYDATLLRLQVMWLELELIILLQLQ